MSLSSWKAPDWLLSVDEDMLANEKKDKRSLDEEKGDEGSEAEDGGPSRKSPATIVSAATKKAANAGKGSGKQAILNEMIPILATVTL